jgi:hypothetical protein
MKIWKYIVKKDEKKSFYIQEHSETVYTIWHDFHEGGTAHDGDWNQELGYWSSLDSAYDWIVEKYGPITEVDE